MKRVILAALLAVFFPAVLVTQQLTGSQGEARCKITLNGKWLEYKTF